MYNFEFEKPASIADAVAALAEEDAQALGGGQTLLPTMKQRLAMPSKLVSLAGIGEMQGVCREDDGSLAIGGATTHATVASEAAAHYPALAELASHIGDPAVRNRGTIGGSLANNDPAACYPAAVLGSGATVITNAREIGADDYFDGLFTTALEEGEIITGVRFPVPEAANYQKFVQPASRFALVGVFVAKYADGVRVAVTGASEEGVFRWSEAEQALGKEFRPDALTDLRINPANMMGDIHGTKEYRAHLVGVLTKRAVAAAAG
ncbi:FAD binding domain-containing protein [Phaeobacter gallaeciensis]|uniref:FAD binding domain-containing protein n=1 Tax=Phaeobacter gallaeciensis TaxID=60890 RepID=UPI00237F4CE2|nr:xanthine dehydrogenase family protein subunit M [Phaeobacter gallaeciensis]MDE4189584.1 xanthine dehydrogenase family protein subunit M [Phaeobacter gallaeciensis]MDE4198736.1 xanthine dehydrogenase family protein subunit M [Phaeobacter gallaeciensis]MDE4202881.1 xanthine dehydrogenase family protein subunit M [Phaeobacter gallaeciensis]MDE4207025.1 xanthine dehydrogenase family protein subunit M [Phaeobacter gallaeciensis]MDE4215750.1 xanthine dehydrogenase family protein subunit M [Phaeob